MWKLLSVLLSLLLLLSLPIYSEIVLTDEEYAELEMIWTELEELLEKQVIQLELAETQLIIASEAIKELEQSLSEAKLSLLELEKEQTIKKITWAISGLLAGGFLGVVLE